MYISLLCAVYVRFRVVLFPAGKPFLPSPSVNIFCRILFFRICAATGTSPTTTSAILAFLIPRRIVVGDVFVVRPASRSCAQAAARLSGMLRRSESTGACHPASPSCLDL
jgi:hypothetical protein